MCGDYVRLSLVRAKKKCWLTGSLISLVKIVFVWVFLVTQMSIFQVLAMFGDFPTCVTSMAAAPFWFPTPSCCSSSEFLVSSLRFPSVNMQPWDRSRSTPTWRHCSRVRNSSIYRSCQFFALKIWALKLRLFVPNFKFAKNGNIFTFFRSWIRELSCFFVRGSLLQHDHRLDDLLHVRLLHHSSPMVGLWKWFQLRM